MKPTIVVSGINLFQGGTLTIYYNFCDEIIESKLYEKYHFILFVHKVSLFEKYQSYFEIIELPESRKSWFKRMYYEYSYFKIYSKDKDIYLWISIHDMTPKVHAKHQVTYFHISDEPREEHLESYRAAKESLGNMLDGFHTFDALSSYEFYRHGLIDKPIPGNNEIEEFLEHGLTDMWTYYCTGQFYEVSNRFMSMPSARNRIYGVQLYKYKIIGILHWGYNFYNSQFSIEHINPYEVTDAGNAFPSGDPFLVYPGADRNPEESIRMMVHYEALTDLRALELLESLTSREHVMELIEGELAEPLTFKRYPKSDMYLIMLRNRVNKEIQKFGI